MARDLGQGDAKDKSGRRNKGMRGGSTGGRNPGMGRCLPRDQIVPAVQIRSELIREKVEQWKEKALIGKFVGIWLKEKDLIC